MNQRTAANTQVVPAAENEVSSSRRTMLAWVGLLCLILGLGLLDRGFVGWRNGPWNLPNANGVYPADEKPAPGKRARTFNPAPVKILAGSGSALLLFSIVLFGIEPLRIGTSSR